MTQGCHNRPPFADSYPAQDGWNDDGTRRMTAIPFRNSRDCEYRLSELGKTDPACAGCPHHTTPKENP